MRSRLRTIAGLTIGLAGCGPSAREEAFAGRAEALSVWTQAQELVSSLSIDSTYGRSIAVSGDTALILRLAGSSTFRRVGSAWVLQTGSQAVDTSGAACWELNGPAHQQWAGTLSGDTALIVRDNLPGHFGPCVYLRSGNDWSIAQALEANNSDEILTGSFAISGDTAMMQSSLGVAVFERSSGVFSHTQTLATSDGVTGAKPFALFGDAAVLVSSGSAYLFARQATGWVETGVLAAESGLTFGSVVMSAERLLLQGGTTTSVYTSSSSGWVLEAQLTQGGAMDVLGETLLLGNAVYERIAGTWSHTLDFSLDPPPHPPLPAKHIPLTDLALWEGGALVGQAGDYFYDGLNFHDAGHVYSFEHHETCAADTECQTGHCVEGVCCQTDCSGACESCLATRKGGGLDGVCGPVTVNTDPRDSCAAAPLETCGQTGLCDGAGQCALSADGAPCVAGYVCESGQCATECTPDFGCDTAHGYECVASACQMPPAVGGTGGTSSSGGTGGASEGGSDSDAGGAGGAPTTSAGAGGDTPDATTGGSSGGDAPSASGGAPATSGGRGGAPSTSTGGIDQPAAGAGKTSQPHGLRAGGGCHVRPGAAEHSGWGALFVALLLSTRRRIGFGVASKKRARST